MKRLKRLGCLLISVCILFCGCTKETPHATSLDFRMDTWVSQEWYGDLAQETCDEIDASLAEIEKKISLYIDDSDISKINAAAGKEYVEVSEDVFYLIKDTLAVCGDYDGAFDISIAPLALLWDVTAEEPKIPSEDDIIRAQSLVDYKNVLLDEKTHSVMLTEEGMMLDLGGAAKGWAVGKMKDIVFKNNVSGFLSVGGNMLVVGKKPNGNDFLVGIRDPRGESSEYFAALEMDGYTMATTGDYERFFEIDSTRYHHIIDPFTGYPSDGGLMSVTVISENGLLADCLSTAVFLEGKEGLDDALSRSDCMIVAVTDEGEVYASSSAWERLDKKDTSGYKFIGG